MSIFLSSGVLFCSLLISFPIPAPIALVLHVLVNTTGSLEIQVCCFGYFGSFIFYCRSDCLPPRSALGGGVVLPWIDSNGEMLLGRAVLLHSPHAGGELPSLPAQTAPSGAPDSFMVDQPAGWSHPVVGAVLEKDRGRGQAGACSQAGKAEPLCQSQLDVV